MERIWNFSAGPSLLPAEVLGKAAAELTNYRGSGMSVMEMSHRTDLFAGIVTRAEADLRSLLAIPDNYRVLFLQGGASTQFAMVPLNLMRKGRAAYINSGIWSQKAMAEARRYGRVLIAANGEADGFVTLPDVDDLAWDQDLDYVHITSNNTSYGTAFSHFPDTGEVPLVADMSSDILSRRLDINRFGLIYAGAQKNVGTAGVTLVIIREDLLGWARPETPTMLRYDTAAENGSMYNTGPGYAIYITGLVLQWLLAQGGVPEMERRKWERAGLVYDFLDAARHFIPSITLPFRSPMNLTWRMTTPDMEQRFVSQAEKIGLMNLGGHGRVGGLRASLYNAMPLEGVYTLVDFMKGLDREF